VAALLQTHAGATYSQALDRTSVTATSTRTVPVTGAAALFDDGDSGDTAVGAPAARPCGGSDATQSDEGSEHATQPTQSQRNVTARSRGRHDGAATRTVLCMRAARVDASVWPPTNTSASPAGRESGGGGLANMVLTSDSGHVVLNSPSALSLRAGDYKPLPELCVLKMATFLQHVCSIFFLLFLVTPPTAHAMSTRKTHEKDEDDDDDGQYQTARRHRPKRRNQTHNHARAHTHT
jgi:hypothetical protein